MDVYVFHGVKLQRKLIEDYFDKEYRVESRQNGYDCPSDYIYEHLNGFEAVFAEKFGFKLMTAMNECTDAQQYYIAFGEPIYVDHDDTLDYEFSAQSEPTPEDITKVDNILKTLGGDPKNYRVGIYIIKQMFL